MAEGHQLDLLDDDGRVAWRERLRQRVRLWAERGVYFGTSSWKYEGWLGQIYSRERYQTRGRFSPRQFEQRCLEEYAELFPSVCGDFSFYQFYRPEYWQRLFAQVPADFKFGFKAPEQITAPRFPNHDRYGARAGQDNPDFLNASMFAEQFLDRLAPHRRQVGYIVFQFPQLHRAAAGFVEKLDAFLASLPASWPLAAEVRDRTLLTADYFASLKKRGVAHAFNSWTHMPAIGEQLELPGAFTTKFAVARVLLKPGRNYEEAVKKFQPYAEVRDPHPAGYQDVARLVRKAQRETFIAVNNRFVGNAPIAISAILDELDKP